MTVVGTNHPSMDLRSNAGKISKNTRLNTAKPCADSISKGGLAHVKGRSTPKVKSSNTKKDDEKKEIKYSDMVNLNIIKKFDTEAQLDQNGNQSGDCHLPRGKLY